MRLVDSLVWPILTIFLESESLYRDTEQPMSHQLITKPLLRQNLWPHKWTTSLISRQLRWHHLPLWLLLRVLALFRMPSFLLLTSINRIKPSMYLCNCGSICPEQTSRQAHQPHPESLRQHRVTQSCSQAPQQSHNASRPDSDTCSRCCSCRRLIAGVFDHSRRS